MSTLSRVQVRRVIDEADRRDVVTVLRATYQREKQWVSDPETQVPQADLAREDIAWFIATIRGRPAGVLRVHFAPPLAQYAEYGFKLMDPRIDVDDFIRRNRVAEIGRFAVLQRYRRQFLLAAALMRAATAVTRLHAFRYRRVRGRPAQPVWVPHPRHRLSPGGHPRCRRVAEPQPPHHLGA
jgi:hypothetical protein